MLKYHVRNVYGIGGDFVSHHHTLRRAFEKKRRMTGAGWIVEDYSGHRYVRDENGTYVKLSKE